MAATAIERLRKIANADHGSYVAGQNGDFPPGQSGRHAYDPGIVQQPCNVRRCAASRAIMTIVRSTLTMAYRKTTAGLRGIGRKFESKTDYMRRVDYCDTLHGAWHQDIETPEPIGCAFIPLDQ